MTLDIVLATGQGKFVALLGIYLSSVSIVSIFFYDRFLRMTMTRPSESVKLLQRVDPADNM